MMMPITIIVYDKINLHKYILNIYNIILKTYLLYLISTYHKVSNIIFLSRNQTSKRFINDYSRGNRMKLRLKPFLNDYSRGNRIFLTISPAVTEFSKKKSERRII